MKIPQPNIGDWYRNPSGTFEVVAYDEDDGTIEIQYFDGTIEEMEREDWIAQWKEGSLEAAEAPEDWSGSVDVDPPEEDSGSDSVVGERDLLCSPWTTVTRNPQGWKGPCYLITNGHYKTFAELHAATDWEYYRTKQDIRCRDCKLHSGFEGTVAMDFGKNLKDSWRMVRHYMS